jgi:hypothetical protein
LEDEGSLRGTFEIVLSCGSEVGATVRPDGTAERHFLGQPDRAHSHHGRKIEDFDLRGRGEEGVEPAAPGITCGRYRRGVSPVP